MTRRGKSSKASKRIVVAVAPKRKKSKREKEITRLGYALRALGGLGGKFVGNYFGEAEAGGGIGRSIGASISRWLGSGDYTVSTNSLLSPSGTVPAMHNENQSVVVRHKEFVGQIVSSQAFSVQQSYPLNPGLIFTFPWLARIAANFQEYRIRGMIFHYIPSSGDAVASTNPALGTVMIQTSYRATDTAPSSKVELLNEYWSSENVPAQPFCHPIECDPKENPFNIQYVRSGSVPTGDSLLMYDLGVTHIATSGMQTDGNPVGDLWITYEVELKKPIISSNATSQAWSFTALYEKASFSGTTLFDVSPTLGVFNSLSVVDNDMRTLSLPKGCVGIFRFMLSFNSTAFTAHNMSGAPTLTNCTSSYVCGSTAGTIDSTAGSESSADKWRSHTCDVLVSDPTKVASVTYPVYTFTGTVPKVLVSITQVA